MEEPRNWNQVGSSSIRGRLRTPNDNNWNSKSVAVKRQRGSTRREWRDSSRRKRKRKKLLGEKIADWIRASLAFLFSNVGIVCLVVGYTIAGAFIFETIEGTYSRKVGNGYDVPLSRNETAILLWDLTYKENIFAEELWRSKVNNILINYQKKLVNAVEKGWDGSDSSDIRKWTFASAFLYSLTVITTIGYGNTTPKTMWGKVITIGYAIAGMPLFLLYLSNIGDILARSFKWTYARCCLCRCRKKPRVPRDPRSSGEAKKNTWQMVKLQSGRLDTVSLDGEIESLSKSTGSDEDNDDDSEEEDDDDDDDDESDRYDPQRITVPLTLCLGIMVGYICGGAVLFSEWEDWDFLDGSYFCFVSLSTIGFGDIVPGDKIYSGQGIELSFIFCSMYLMLGMALIAMCFNLMQEEVMAKMRSFTRTVKHVLRCDR